MSDEIEACIKIGNLALPLELLSPALRRRFEVAASMRENAAPGPARKTADAEFKKVADDAKIELAPYLGMRLAPRGTIRR
jgi:hypothetical protein